MTSKECFGSRDYSAGQPFCLETTHGGSLETSSIDMLRIPIVFAQGQLTQNLGQVAGVLHSIALVLFFGGLLMSAIMFMIGRTEYLKYGLVGAGLGGLAWIIVSTFFNAGSGVDPGIQLTPF